jgi:hypothetical protein
MIKVVVKPVVNPGADGDLSLGKQPLHRHGHDVGKGMANALEML